MRLMNRLILTLTTSIILVLAAASPSRATFSIVAWDPVTGDLGVAVQSKFLGVGAVVPFAKAGVGAVATQALGNPTYGPRGLELLSMGLTPEEVIEVLTRDDPEREQRQVGIVAPGKPPAAFTGSATLSWAGHIVGDTYAVQGNILAGPEVVEAMAEAFERTAGRPLGERLIAALRAGQEAGGDSRGQQSAALIVVRPGGGYGGYDDRMVDIRVDDHPEPIEELARIYEVWQETFLVGSWLSSLERYREEGNDEAAGLQVRWALQVLDRVEKKQGPDPDLLNALAWNLAINDLELERALALARRAVELKPDSPEILDTLAEALFRLGRVEEAIETELKAIELDPDSAYLKEQLARFMRGKGEEKED